MGRSQYIGGVTHYVVPYKFTLLNMSNTNGTLLADGTVNQEYWIHRQARIVGFAGTLNAALTTGSLTFFPTIDGSVCPNFSNSVLHTNQQAAGESLDAAQDNYLLTAGQALGLRYTSSDTVNPETTDAVCIVEVLLEDVRY